MSPFAPFFGILSAAAALSVVAAQFVSPPDDLIATIGHANLTVRYKEVPTGICEMVEGVKSFSGYVDVEENQHIFFWFIEARHNNPSEAPLTIFLNGGPGDPSMVGLFSENGPCIVDNEGNLHFNPYSWNNVSNMIYIDQPTQTGFSYSVPLNGYIDAVSGELVPLLNGSCPTSALSSCGTYSNGDVTLTANSTPAAAPNVWKTLQGFMGAFPQYSSNGIHLSTESYGGHYGPIFAEYFEEQDAANIPNTTRVDLRSLTVGNGWFDPRIQYPSYYNFTVTPGNTYDFTPFNRSSEADLYAGYFGAGNCTDQLAICNSAAGTDDDCSSADDFCYGLELVYDDVTGRDEYDLRELSPDSFPPTGFVAYLNTPRVQQAIGAYVNFSYAVTNLGAGTVANAFGSTGDDARAFDIPAVSRRLVEDHGIYTVHYAGDADYNCNWRGGEQVADTIGVAGFCDAGYADLDVGRCGKPAGAVRQTGLYAFARIYDSGHSVPFYQPRAALTIFERVIRGLDLATGTINVLQRKGHVTGGPSESDYHQGNSTIQVSITPSCAIYDSELNVPVMPANCSADY